MKITRTDEPEWLSALWRHRDENGDPSLRAIARASEIALGHTTISKIFSGQLTPRREALQAIARAVADNDQVEVIMQLFDTAAPPAPQPQHPSLVLARAIDNLADAIRELGRSR